MTHAPFDPERYRSAAAHYERGRVPYPPALIRRVAEGTGLGLQHRVLDLGCGPGPLARSLAPLAREVIAIDPPAEMLTEARALARQAANIHFIAGSSYDRGPATTTCRARCGKDCSTATSCNTSSTVRWVR
jgi:SAM-dependent methyltransferase